jgi:hypothetical protein
MAISIVFKVSSTTQTEDTQNGSGGYLNTIELIPDPDDPLNQEFFKDGGALGNIRLMSVKDSSASGFKPGDKFKLDLTEM